MKTLLFAFALAGGMFAQQEAPTPVPVTKQELQNSERRTKKAIEKATDGVVEGQKGVARSLEKGNTDTRRVIQDGQAAITTEVAKQGDKTVDEISRTIWRVGFVFVGVFLIAGAAGVALVIRKKRKAKAITIANAEPTYYFRDRPDATCRLMVPEVSVNHLPDDPTESQVETFARAIGLASFPGTVRLPEFENVLVSGGTFTKNNTGAWVVDYPGIQTRVFANRRRSAKEYYLLHSRSSTGQQGSTSVQ